MGVDINLRDDRTQYGDNGTDKVFQSEPACYVLPDNTESLLTQIHNEFYGGELAHADSYRLIPSIISILKKHKEIK